MRSYRELIRTLAEKTTTPAVVLALRKQVGEGTANAILEIASLQSKAISKFGNGVWMVNSRSLQQATDSMVANYKASLFPDCIVIDLCGGVGGDAMGFARRGPVITVDSDPRVTSMAAENLHSIDAQDAVAICANVTTYFTPKQVASERIGLHIDPDRRPNEQRTTAPDRYSPSFDFVSAMIAASKSAIIKLAPAASIDALHASQNHRHWISLQGSVREQSLLCGASMDVAGLFPGGCSAVRLFRDGRRELFAATTDSRDHQTLSTTQPLSYMFDFDPAVRAAGLSAMLGSDRELACLGEASGFFTSDTLPDNRSMTQCFECVWTGPADVKQLRKVVGKLELSVDVVKVRGTDHDPVKLQNTLRSKLPGKSTTLLIGRSTTGIYAALAFPVNELALLR